ncbi:MAG: hypothetical protein GX937_05950 [Lentisphaerae bacterium]|jgi:hypothetical protein|nr:hypothetical protein [Lentisphaerota bacterium]
MSTTNPLASVLAPLLGTRVFLADDYPSDHCSPVLDDAFLAAASQRGERLFIEYPRQVGRLQFASPRQCHYERTIVFRPFGDFAVGEIMTMHSCWLRLPEGDLGVEPLLIAGVAAGYRKIAYEMPDGLPVLFFHPNYPQVLIASGCLSCFQRARYAPHAAWRDVWTWILQWLGVKEPLPDTLPALRPTYGPDDELPPDAKKTMYQRQISWLTGSCLGDYSGIQVSEGFNSDIDAYGRQKPRFRERSDCMLQVATALVCDSVVNSNPESRRLGTAIIDQIFRNPAHFVLDPKNPCYSQFTFYENVFTHYTFGNCWNSRHVLAAASLLGTNRWDHHVLRCLVSILRSANQNGCRRINLRYPESFSEHNWDWYATEDYRNFCPHRQAGMWETFILAFRLTGHQPFLDVARKGLTTVMQDYPRLQWMNNYSAEVAKLIMPLSFLLRLEDTPQHRAWLERVVADLEALFQPCGAIADTVRDLELATYPPPRSNAEYGTREACLIQENGDPCCDLLYTVPFAYAGLHEAYAATGNEHWRQLSDRITDFIIRVQAVSPEHPELSGAWLRGFDYQLWEYWSSSADAGWGAWCAETGWTNAPIAITLAFQKLKTSFYDLIEDGRLRSILPEILREMSVVHPLPNAVNAASTQKPPGTE